MPDRGEDREIKRRVTAHEAEVVRASKELARKTAQGSVKRTEKRARGAVAQHAMTDDLRRRSAVEVFEDHLRLASEHQFEEDIERNVSPDIVILERRGIFRGREGARELARLLEQELPTAPYLYTNRLTEGRLAFLEWTSEAEHARVRDGADSFLIENGWIVAQTIHYTVEAK